MTVPLLLGGETEEVSLEETPLGEAEVGGDGDGDGGRSMGGDNHSENPNPIASVEGGGTTEGLGEDPASQTGTMGSGSTAGGRFTLLRTAVVRSPLLKIPTAADSILTCYRLGGAPILLGPLGFALTSGRWGALGLVGGWITLTVLWLPFKALSLLLTEVGVYALLVACSLKIGRSLVRLIAFPGSTHRVYGEIESEFTRYSLRMLDAACVSVCEAAGSVSSLGGGDDAEDEDEDDDEDSDSGMAVRGVLTSYRASPQDAALSWKKARSYRDRVLGMYYEVLTYLLRTRDDGRPGGSVVAAAAAASSFSELGGSGGEIAVGLNKYGNNLLRGDVGDLWFITPQALDDARSLSPVLQRVLADMDETEAAAGDLLSGNGNNDPGVVAVSPRAVRAARRLLKSATELRVMLPSLRSQSNGGDNEDGNDDVGRSALQSPVQPREDAPTSGGAARLQGSQSFMGAIKTAVDTVLPVLDPPPHLSVFGLDMLRGSMLSRYKGASQIWVHRTGRGGGKVDVVHIPGASYGESGPAGASGRGRRIAKAVLYCNPNAGLLEVAAGMSLIGGNAGADADGNLVTTPSSAETCWTDFYINLGYDVFLFNYAGFGRSHGGAEPPTRRRRASGYLPCLGRILRGGLWDFLPSSSSMKADAHDVAQYLISHMEVESLTVHGESIGGMAAAHAARKLCEDPSRPGVAPSPVLTANGAVRRRHPSLLLCDRSFTNLEGVAQRLVGSWTGPTIRTLVPLWSTDVARDFLASDCPKVVATDAADAIIADGSSLKSGMALSIELRRGNTHGVGWVREAPLEYRMSDWEDSGAGKSRFVKCNGGLPVNIPVWPNDRRLTERDCFHFAACARRIGKVATATKRRMGAGGSSNLTGGAEHSDDEEEGIEISELELELTGQIVMPREGGDANVDPDGKGSDGEGSPPSETSMDHFILVLWQSLACADGLCGAPLGYAVREGPDVVVSWLCCAVTYGGQAVARNAQGRTAAGVSTAAPSVLPGDFDSRPIGHALTEEDGTGARPVPLPEVAAVLRRALEPTSVLTAGAAVDVGGLSGLIPELRYCLGMMEYVIARLSSPLVARESARVLRFVPSNEGGLLPGRFMDLNCGHNNQYSEGERNALKEILRLAEEDGGVKGSGVSDDLV